MDGKKYKGTLKHGARAESIGKRADAIQQQIFMLLEHKATLTRDFWDAVEKELHISKEKIHSVDTNTATGDLDVYEVD